MGGQVRHLILDIIRLNYLFSAWLTAAVDNERVIGAVPIVMDILNFQAVRL